MHEIINCKYDKYKGKQNNKDKNLSNMKVFKITRSYAITAVLDNA